jgi:hypothetical protein
MRYILPHPADRQLPGRGDDHHAEIRMTGTYGGH